MWLDVAPTQHHKLLYFDTALNFLQAISIVINQSSMKFVQSAIIWCKYIILKKERFTALYLLTGYSTGNRRRAE